MKAFTYERARTPAEAAAAAARTPGAKFVAGGTNLLDLMKLEIETPTHLAVGKRQEYGFLSITISPATRCRCTPTFRTRK